MTPFRADLHCHSTCSDGTLSPIEIVHLAKEIGLSALSITDHDTIEAYTTAVRAAKEVGITLLSGVEFSSSHQGDSVHILGYGIKLDSPQLNDFCIQHTERRKKRNHAILQLLEKHQMPISEEELFATAQPPAPRKTIGRPHIAMAMVNKGYVDSIVTAFRKFIGEGKPCYVQGPVFTIEETLDVIHRAGGIAIIAHPHLIQNDGLVHRLLELNFDGIECYYGRFHADKHQRWIKIAKKKGWLQTGGSDFHGSVKENLPLGSSWIDEEAFNALLDKIQQAAP